MSARIQRQRTKGWRMPEGAIYVGRPTRWGSPFYVPGKDAGRQDGTVFDIRVGVSVRTRSDSVDAYRRELENWNLDSLARWLAPLRGHDLACWCPLDQPCHGDVLLELANR